MKKHGITLIEICIVAGIGTALTLGVVHLMRGVIINTQQEQNRLGEEQRAEESLQSLTNLLKRANPMSIAITSPNGSSWAGLQFSAEGRVYHLYQTKDRIMWQKDSTPAETWLASGRGLRIAVDQAQNPTMVWVAFEIGTNQILFMRKIALQHPG
jgi:hypothetical protein